MSQPEERKKSQNALETLQSKEESVSVAVEVVTSQEWAEKVYKPDIQDKWDTLYKKPGDTM